MNACCFTGHRLLPDPLSEEYRKLLSALNRAIEKAIGLGCTDFYAGGAVGFDLLAAEQVLRFKERFPALKLYLCEPYIGHTKSFSAKDRKRYDAVREHAECIYMLAPEYSRACFKARNAYMVENTDCCIAYVRYTKSGSSQTMRLAQKSGRKVIRI